MRRRRCLRRNRHMIGCCCCVMIACPCWRYQFDESASFFSMCQPSFFAYCFTVSSFRRDKLVRHMIGCCCCVMIACPCWRYQFDESASFFSMCQPSFFATDVLLFCLSPVPCRVIRIHNHERMELELQNGIMSENSTQVPYSTLQYSTRYLVQQ